MTSEGYSFIRYLSAKKNVDSRALNRHVWQSLAESLPPAVPEAPLLVLEVGAGIGTMLERMLECGLLGNAVYTAIDAQRDCITEARSRLQRWAQERNFKVTEIGGGELLFEHKGHRLVARLEAIDVFDFIKREQGSSKWDLLIAHAFLDLTDITAILPRLFSVSRERALFYFTLNFDGLTILEPVIGPHLDELIQSLYHQTMDERIVNGKVSGDSRAGRHLFTYLKDAGAHIMDAGSSDWVVFAGPIGYSEDEAYFLHFIINTIDQALKRHPQLDTSDFTAWVAKRHAQIEHGELVCIIHQLDFVGRCPG
ncbi:MAG: class I SAM-dependent methyltransferase [Chloroflexota bacterium]